MRYLLCCVILVTFGACTDDRPPSPSQPPSASSLPPITVKQGVKMLFTFAKSDGTFETVEALDKVPEQQRGWVRVVDLHVKPAKRQDHELVYVADLREKRKDGTYPYVVLPRPSFESAAVNRAGSGATDKAPPQGKTAGRSVILYATSWCPACRAARDYMTQNKIPFVEKDIEKDHDAAAELLRKARAAGISASGVPVLDVNGKLLQGFDPQRLQALLGDKK